METQAKSVSIKFDMDNIEKNRVNPERGVGGNNDDDDEMDTKKNDKKQDSKKHSSKDRVDNSTEKTKKKSKRAVFFQELDVPTKKDTQKITNKDEVNRKDTEDADQEAIKSDDDAEVKSIDTSIESTSGVGSYGEQEEGLSDDEVHEAINIIIDARGDELREELNDAEEGSSQQLEVIAHTLFLESLRKRADSEEPLTPASVDEAYDEVIDDLEYFPDDYDKETGDVASESVDIAIDGNMHNEVPDVVIPPPPSLTPPPRLTIPPVTPPGGLGGPSGPSFQNPHMFNAQPSQSNQHNSTPNYNRQPYQRKRNYDLLVGAVVGYMVGRRGGRKRTEKRLNPEIDKLESEVVTLNSVIAEKELRIREVARKKVEQKSESTPVVNITETVVINRQKRIEKNKITQRKTELVSNPKVEKLGVFNLKTLEVFREKRFIDGSENSPKRKPVEIMTVKELSEKVQGVRVDDIDILQAYKDGRISQETLREVTKLYMRSGDYKNYFRRELQNDPKELEQTRESVGKMYNQSTVQPMPAREDTRTNQSQQAVADTNASKHTDTAINTPGKDKVNDNKRALPWTAVATVGAIVAILLLLTFA